MTPPAEIAEKIVTEFNSGEAALSNTEETYLQEKIAVALREYGNQCSAGMQTTMTKMAHEWVDKARAEALKDVCQLLQSLQFEKRKCSPEFDGHDDRWCPACADMEDAYGYAETKIRALAKEAK